MSSLHLPTVPCRTHPHRDAEIFSYVLEGQLTHKDSMGNLESLSRGAVQYLSAGSGITHSVGGRGGGCPSGDCATLTTAWN